MVVLSASSCVEPVAFTEKLPNEPVLRTPMNGAYVGSTVANALQPRLTWKHEKVYEDEQYEIEVSADRTFGSVDLPGTTASPSFTASRSTT